MNAPMSATQFCMPCRRESAIGICVAWCWGGMWPNSWPSSRPLGSSWYSVRGSCSLGSSRIAPESSRSSSGTWESCRADSRNLV
ncbi:hypothetical protein E2C01_014373 [Portunus trituberculatus]|uniref:Uncharacterized protein n=1 Tax=Portunus trituberculatus TaxID=210409 RepID=A0A5B7DJZ0_PORTR|nr:hypothetical protein [Portunus trituberculatus]